MKPNHIEILPSEVIDQIAAGEVVERPAHLVKELVENSLDAGATSIHIEFSEGGRFVRVTDNGNGISKQQLGKALDRHATSKIRKSEDLWTLNSFGFRGEALASISAVSDLTLLSKPKGEAQAARIQSRFGLRGEVEEVSSEIGTAITIDKLFENIPARLKFLKSAAAEGSRIKMTLKALALANPAVEFRIHQDGKLVHFWQKSQSAIERAETILETKLYQSLKTVNGITVKAYFGDPESVQKTSKDIWLFAQGRWIQDRSIQTAVMEAYRNLLMHGEFPVAVVFVEVDPHLIDVNIHPTKSQVKFLEPSSIFRAVQATLREVLEKAPWIQDKTTQFAGSAYEIPASESQQSTSPFSFETMNSVAGPLSQNERQQQVEQATLNFAEENLSKAAYFQQKSWSYQTPTTKSAAPEISRSVNENPQPAESKKYWSHLQVLGQSKLTYILTQTQNALVIVDQHAAHERVMFEKLMSAWRGGQLDTQDFLFPLAIDLSAEKVEAMILEKANFQKFGLFIELLGPETIGVVAAPVILKEAAISSILEKMAHDMVELGGSFQMEKKIGDIFSSMACHSAVRAGQSLSFEEMKALLEQMDEYPLSSFCPHGRPVSVEYPFTELERDFGRTV